MQDIKGTLFSMTKTITKTSGDFLKQTKLSMNLSAEESNLKTLYMDIGKKVHEIYQYGGSLGKFFDEKYHELEACERKISDLKNQISVLKGVKSCPKCGKNIEKSAEFCQTCGIRVELGHEVLEAVATTPVAEPASPIEAVQAPTPNPPPVAPTPPKQYSCRVCGSYNDGNSKFCLSCGRILD